MGMTTDQEFYIFRRKTHRNIQELYEMIDEQQKLITELTEYMIEQKEREAEDSDQDSTVFHPEPDPAPEPDQSVSYCTIS